MLALQLLPLFLVLAAVPAPIALAAPNGEPPGRFELSFTSQAPADIRGFRDAHVSDFAVSIRTTQAPPEGRVLGIQGRADRVWIDRHETSWTRDDPSPIHGPGDATIGPAERVTTTAHADARFEFSLAHPDAAAILRAEQADVTMHEEGGLRVWSVLPNPFLASPLPTDTPLSENRPEERASWQLLGDYIIGAAPGFNASSRGALEFYWFNGTLSLRDENGSHLLESRAWVEPAANTPRLQVWHAVWYVLRSEDARVDLAIQGSAPAVNALTLFRAAHVEAATSFTIDSARYVEGTLPESSQVNGSSLWVWGTFDVGFEAQPGSGPYGPDPPTYRVSLEGVADRYAVGGSSPWAAGVSEEALGAYAILAGTALVLYYMRETAAVLLGRLWVPLYAKLRRGDLLKHEARDVLYRLVQQSPGINFMELHRRYRTLLNRSPRGWGSFVHHLVQMEHFGFIASRRQGRFRRYFADENRSIEDAERIGLLRDPQSGLIARLVHEHEPVTLVELLGLRSSGDGVKRATLQYHLKRLAYAHLVVIGKSGRRHVYSASHHLARLRAHLES